MNTLERLRQVWKQRGHELPEDLEKLAVGRLSKRLAELLIHKNPQAEDYRYLASKVFSEHGSSHIGYNSIEDEIENVPGIRDFLKSKLAGKILIDLGCSPHVPFTPSAEELEVETYIGVERYLLLDDDYDKDESIYTDADPLRDRKIERDQRSILVCSDMLDFISRVRTGSSNIILAGIDALIIRNWDYHKALATEIERVCEPGGLVMGAESEALDMLHKTSFTRVELPFYNNISRVYQKKE